jgi:hypothetical protein
MNSNLVISNKIIMSSITGMFLMIVCVFFLIPAIFFFLSPMSRIGAFFSSYFFYIIIFIGICAYFMYYTFFFNLYLDPYVLKVSSYNPFKLFSNNKKNIEISHAMLKKFSLEKINCESSRILKLEILTSSGRNIRKEFPLTFLHDKQRKCLTDRLNNILHNNQNI